MGFLPTGGEFPLEHCYSPGCLGIFGHGVHSVIYLSASVECERIAVLPVFCRSGSECWFIKTHTHTHSPVASVISLVRGKGYHTTCTLHPSHPRSPAEPRSAQLKLGTFSMVLCFTSGCPVRSGPTVSLLLLPTRLDQSSFPRVGRCCSRATARPTGG
jgi:hypothetical protein